MIITWYGQSCFKIQSSKAIIIIDPFGRNIGLKAPRLRGDVVLITHDHPDHNNIERVKNDPFLVKNPGEYEVRGVFIQGIDAFHDNSRGKKQGLNTIFTISLEGMRICHLGDLGQKELSSSQLEAINGVDILMIPVGGVFTIDGEGAARIVHQIEPRIIIPMHYKIPGLKIKLHSLEPFLKEMGVEKEEVSKLSIKKKDIPQEEVKVVVMSLK